MIISVKQLAILFLIIARLAGVFIRAPLFNSRSFPFVGKTAIVIWTSIVLWFVTPVFPLLPTTMPGFITAILMEVALGFVIGFICDIIFIAIQAAGEIADMQMGLSVATALDPVFGAVISVIGRLSFFLALIIFITANGHHLLLTALQQSFTVLPVGHFANFTSPDMAQQIIGLGGALWVTGIKLAAPAVLLIFISDFTFGVVSRVAPQVNVFMLGFQVKPSLGIFALLLTLPFILKYVNNLVGVMMTQITFMLSAVK
ncbi:MAG: flagellar biosynthetic protein FliR [bacterium]